jgi:NAD-reducing hydrogenase large subunit
MGRKIVIEPVTRIEGHAKIVIRLDDHDRIESARFHVNEFRGFEKFCEGRMFFEMPQITQRICGICPVSHHLAAAKACDQIIGIDPPRPAKLLRELMHMGQIIQSHSMHFFELAGPDLLLGFDADPATRNIVGLAQADPQLTLKAIKLRKFGQEIIAQLGERRVHPTLAVPGGVTESLDPKSRDAILGQIDEMIGLAKEALAIARQWMEAHVEDLRRFAVFATNYMGLVSQEDALELYDGVLRLVNAKCEPIHTFDPRQDIQHIAEHVEDWSYLKFPFYKQLGWPQGCYRVGPLARLNASTHIATPLAQEEYKFFHQLCGGDVVQGSLYYHYARLVENLYAIERARELLCDDEILSDDVRTCRDTVARREGVGVIEAPRGTLWHHYWVNDDGVVERVNLIVATGNNNYAMCRAVEEVAKQYIDPSNITEGSLNRLEAAIRAYDPCLSCSTHATGQMPIEVILEDADGRNRSTITRGRPGG